MAIPINKELSPKDTVKVLKDLVSQVSETPENDNIINKLQLETSNVVRTSIKNWQTAYECAIDVEDPDREELLELFEQIEIDTHISALIETIYSNIMAGGFVVKDPDGTANLDATDLFKRPWFSKFVAFALDSIYWGYTGIQFTGVEEGSWSDCEIIPRNHILPNEAGIRYSSNSRESDAFFSDPGIDKWTCFLYPNLPGDQYKLGKFNKIAKSFILKREVTQFWAIFNELFGVPYRVMKTDLSNKSRMNNAVSAMEAMTSAAYAIMHTEDDITFHNGASASNTQTFKDFLDTANKEISKALIGSTMVLEDGSSRSQGEVHERNTLAFTRSYGKIVEQMINFILIPKMVNQGFSISLDNRFEFDNETKLDEASIAAIAVQLKQAGFDISEGYIEERTGIPVEKAAPPSFGGFENSSFANKIENLYKNKDGSFKKSLKSWLNIK